MARVEKTVFISYRRRDISWALAVYQYLTSQKFDVFFDYTSIPSGDFEQIISSNIKARAHFILILTPTALDRCSEPGDWLRREIETAIEEKRNIIPLFFEGFSFGLPSVAENLTGKLAALSRYNGLDVPSGYFMEGMARLRSRYLNVPLNAVIHPVSTEVQKVVKEEQVAADRALEEEKEVIEELVKPAEERSVEVEPVQNKKATKPSPPLRSWVRGEVKLPNFRSYYGIGIGVLLMAALGVFGTRFVLQNLGEAEAPTLAPTGTATRFIPTITETFVLPSPSPIPTLGIGSTMISDRDGMVMAYIPEGEFEMGSEDGEEDEKPVHTVYLDAFWIDQTEVTNQQFVLFLNAEENQTLGNEIWSGTVALREGKPIQNVDGIWQVEPEYGNHPVAYASWEGAQAYCEWVDRRLPTEAEWEKAARGNLQGKLYPWGNDSPSCDLGADNGVQYGQCSGGTVPVGSFGQNAYGLYDMAGNVMEWAADWYSSTYYESSPYLNPPGPAEAIPWTPGYQRPPRVLRGGGSDSLWSYFEAFVRVSSRHVPDGATALDALGFRCAMDAAE